MWVFDPNDRCDGIKSFEVHSETEVGDLIARVRERLARAAARNAPAARVPTRPPGSTSPTLRDKLITRLRDEFGHAALECKNMYQWSIRYAIPADEIDTSGGEGAASQEAGKSSGGGVSRGEPVPIALNISLNSAHKPHAFHLWVFDRSAARRGVVSFKIAEERDIQSALAGIREMLASARPYSP